MHLLCVSCQFFTPLCSGMKNHVNNFKNCKDSKVLCISCERSFDTSELPDHQKCKVEKQFDPQWLRPELLLDRLLIVLKDTKASPELASELENILKKVVQKKQRQLKIKAVLSNPQVVESQQLTDLVLTVFAREKGRFPPNKSEVKPPWTKLLYTTLAEMRIDPVNRDIIKKIMKHKKQPKPSPESIKEFIEASFTSVKFKNLATKLFERALEANSRTCWETPRDKWMSQLLSTLAETSMSDDNRAAILKTFHTTKCPIMHGNATKYASDNFHSEELIALAKSVITKAYTCIFPKPTIGKTKKLKTNAKVQNSEKEIIPASSKKQKGKDGNRRKSELVIQSEKNENKELRKKAKSIKPIKNRPSEEVQPETENGKRKRKTKSDVEEVELKIKKKKKKSKKESPVAKTMEKVDRQKGNVFPKPEAGKKEKRSKRKKEAANSA